MDHLDRFAYSPLRPSEIRLIKILPGLDSDIIRCTIQHVSWKDNPQYETLSYVWGADNLYASIILNGRPFLVRRNVWYALYHLRGNVATKARCIREDEVIHSDGRIGTGVMTPENKDLSAHVTGSAARFSIKSAVSKGKAALGWPRKEWENMSTLGSGMRDMSIEQLVLANRSTSGVARTIWIDAICINQHDILERNIQVQMMGMVYEKATCVLIWLGEATGNSRVGLKHFRDLSPVAGRYRNLVASVKASESEQSTKEAISEQDKWDAILELCYRPFWSRLWVIQEVVLSRERLVICGNETLPWNAFENVLKTMVMDKGEQSMSVWKLSEEFRHKFMGSPAVKFFQGLKNIAFAGTASLSSLQFFEDMGEFEEVTTGQCSLRSLVTSFHGSITSDPRDQIYGFLGIAAPAKEVTADYSKTAAELYIDVLKASVWRSNYIDHYLVHFSEVLQRALGDPFWDVDKKSFVPIGHDLSTQKTANVALRVRGILGKRITWAPKSNTKQLLGIVEKPARQSVLQNMLADKEFKGSRTFQQITAFNKEPNSDVFLQRFTIEPYFNASSYEGSALLSQTPNPGDYLCFFKDCKITAVVRLKSGSNHTYMVIGRTITNQHTSFYDWTMECDVEFTLQSLQLLTR